MVNKLRRDSTGITRIGKGFTNICPFFVLYMGYASNTVKISAVADVSFLYYGAISGVLYFY